MPVYNDNKRFLFRPEDRKLITDGLYSSATKLKFNLIAGTSTAGIAWAVLLADRFADIPFVYVRDKPKNIELRCPIKGIDSEDDLRGYKVLLVEDLVHPKSSSAREVQTIRDSKGDCINCLSIFNYGFYEEKNLFKNLNPPCDILSVLTYDTLIKLAKENKYITQEQEKALAEWRSDPFNWGTKHGFPKVDKK